MNNVHICGFSYMLPHSTGFSTAGAIVTDDDISRYLDDRKTASNEQISREFFCTAEKLYAAGLPSHRTGVSFGTSDGCFSSLSTAAEGIAVKGVKGMKPKDASNCTMSGAAAKTAIALGIKGFSLTNCDGMNGGLDAVIFACDMLRSGSADYALAGGGDEGKAYGAVMLSTDDKSEGCTISPVSCGLVFGSDTAAQIKHLVSCAVDNCDTNIEGAVIVSEDHYAEIRTALSEQISAPDISEFSVPDNTTSASGIMAIEYTVSLASVKGSILLVQCGKEGYFSAVMIKK